MGRRTSRRGDWQPDFGVRPSADDDDEPRRFRHRLLSSRDSRASGSGRSHMGVAGPIFPWPRSQWRLDRGTSWTVASPRRPHLDCLPSLLQGLVWLLRRSSGDGCRGLCQGIESGWRCSMGKGFCDPFGNRPHVLWRLLLERRQNELFHGRWPRLLGDGAMGIEHERDPLFGAAWRPQSGDRVQPVIIAGWAGQFIL